MPYPVTRDNFASLVQQALAELPPRFIKFLREVPVELRKRPTPAMLRGLNMAPGSLLLGLYRGIPRTVRSVEDSGRMPDAIYIFQNNIEQVCNNEQELVDQVRKTVLHEIGHHFGLDEEDLERLGYG